MSSTHSYKLFYIRIFFMWIGAFENSLLWETLKNSFWSDSTFMKDINRKLSTRSWLATDSPTTTVLLWCVYWSVWTRHSITHCYQYHHYYNTYSFLSFTYVLLSIFLQVVMYLHVHKNSIVQFLFLAVQIALVCHWHNIISLVLMNFARLNELRQAKLARSSRDEI